MKRIGKDFDFVGNRKIFFTISLVILGIGLLANLIFGVKLDIVFKGGTLIKYSFEGDVNREVVERFVESVIDQETSVQIVENVAGEDDVLNISMADAITMEDQDALDTEIKKEFADHNLNRLNVHALSPVMGKMFLLKCLVAIGLASIFLIIYVAFRFRKIGGWSAGVMALVALLHDVLVAYFAFVIFGIPLNDNFVAVVLAILGYSLNDTIVIYDRIRENRRLMGKDATIAEIVNRSTNQSFTRSFNTGLCTFIAIATVVVFALIYNLESIVSFAVPMMVGVISGCYSTVCVCGPLWVMWQERKAKGKGSAAGGRSGKARA